MKELDPSLRERMRSGHCRVHLIGVAGSGMSGIAGLMLALGHAVSGSDKSRNIEVERLQRLGLRFHHGHAAENLGDAELVIFSSAIRPGNPEYDEAVRRGIPLVRRAAALAEIMAARKGVIVSGMHGKTTTSSMTAHVLRHGGLKPSHYVGAEIPILGTNAHWDPEGEFFVAEGDESDGTLALYRPEHAIVLNIEEEHLDFFKDLDAIETVFRTLLSQTAGKVVYCADDPHASRICASHPGAVSYGASATARYRFDAVHSKDFQSHFRILRDGQPLGGVTLNVPGLHNVSNAVAAVALASEVGVPFPKIAEALESFRGARRRFEIKYRTERCMIVDDYGHHPSEVRATLATARNTGRKRIITIFQPHRYTRTEKLKDEFGRAFHDADHVFITDVYPASEQPIPGISGQTLVDAAVRDGHPSCHYVPDRKQLPMAVARILEPGDCVVCLGAGNIHEAGSALAQTCAILDGIYAAIGTGIVKMYEPLAKHTTMRIGGPAQYWVEPETEEGFANLVRFVREKGLPLFVIGRGSNLLVREGGIAGVVAHLGRGEFRSLQIHDGCIHAGAGVRLKELALAARDARIGGFEWFEGIPGNVGGALRMNAGAMGGETFRQVVSVRYVDAEGQFHTKTPDEMQVAYRHCSTLDHNYAVAATFQGEPAESAAIQQALDASMQKRRTSQPRESSAGCIFKNPGVIPAGRLIDELGLKSVRVGGAKVSEVHGNFIVNESSATSSDVLALIAAIKDKAIKERGISLETEVQIVGQDEMIL